jgi:hypothetical protein
MLISQLYRTNPSLNEKGYEILQNWYKSTNEQKHDHMLWLADQLRAGVDGKTIAIQLAGRLRVKIDPNFPPP